MDKMFGLASGQFLTAAFLLVMVVIFLVDLILYFILYIFPRKRSNKKSSQYVHEAGNDEITDKNDDEVADEDDSEDFYNFKVTIFDSAGNFIKEKELKCQDYECDEDNYFFYFLDENDKDHYIYIEGNFIIYVDEL